MVVAVPLSDAVWTDVAAFLGWDDRYSLLALSSDVVDSLLRRQFFSQSTWRIPPTSTLADRVAHNLSVKRSIRRVAINFTWQQVYLSGFPELEYVAIYPQHEDGDEATNEQEEQERNPADARTTVDFVLSSAIPATVKRLRQNRFRGTPSLAAIAHLVDLEELKLDVGSVSDVTALLPLPRLTRPGLNGEIRGDDTFLSGLRHLRSISVGIGNVRAEVFPVLSPLEDVELMYHTGDISVDLLVRIAPQLKRFTVGSVSFDFASERGVIVEMAPALTSIQTLDLSDVHSGVTPDELAALSRLTTLRQLYLPVEGEVLSLAPLSPLTEPEVEELQVCACPDADWSPLETLKKLRYLSQRANAPEWNESSLHMVSTLPLLTTLLNPTKLSSQFPLPQVKPMQLVSKRVFHSKLVMFDPGCCVNVTDLTLYVQFDVASLVRCFPNVEKLSIVEIPPEDHPRPSPLTSLPRLKHLSVFVFPSYSHKLGFLADMTGIQSLELQSISDLALLRGMKDHLRELILQSVPSTDISVLAELTQLRKLTLQHCTLGSLACLRGHPRLVVLGLPSTARYRDLVNEGGECSLPNLKEMWVARKRVF